MIGDAMLNGDSEMALKARNAMLHNQANKYKKVSEVYSNELNDILEGYKGEFELLVAKYTDEIANLKKLLDIKNKEIETLKVHNEKVSNKLFEYKKAYKKIPNFIKEIFVGGNNL